MAGLSIGSVYLGVKPELEGDPKQLGNSFGNKFGSGAKSSIGAGAVALGNILSNVITSAASTVGQQFVDAFQGSADFEQLFGGVEKIFDEANISGIMDDANEAYKTLNMSVNEYLTSINQTGAAFAATMGDQKGYDTAKQGMQAIADYASGTGRNLDELNEKYALITRATSSYQSIADQFSGILPATSADFLAQAQAAGYLSDSYTKLTEVPIAEYQQAVSAMLQKGVTDMGLWGNTAAESTETVSGSLAMLQSSWSNFLTSLGSGEMSTQEAVDNLVESIVAAAQNIIPRLVEIGASLGEALPQLAEQLSPYIDQLMVQVGAFIQEHQPEIQAAAKVAFDGVKAGIAIALQATIQALGEAIATIITTLPQWYPQLHAAANELFMSIVQGLVLGIQPMMNQLEEAMTGAIRVVTDAISDFFNGGAELATGLANGVASGIGKIGAKFDEIKSTIASALGAAKDRAVQIAGDIRSGFVNAVSSIVGRVRGVFDRVKSAITDPINKAKDLIKSAMDRISSIIGGVKLELPSIKLPHFNVNGGSAPWGIGGKGTPPSFSVDWYAKGGFVNGATLIGAGEQGTEMIWPEYSPYFDKYANAIAERIDSGGITINLNYDAGDDANAMLVDISNGVRQLRAAGAI